MRRERALFSVSLLPPASRRPYAQRNTEGVGGSENSDGYNKKIWSNYHHCALSRKYAVASLENEVTVNNIQTQPQVPAIISSFGLHTQMYTHSSVTQSLCSVHPKAQENKSKLLECVLYSMNSHSNHSEVLANCSQSMQ